MLKDRGGETPTIPIQTLINKIPTPTDLLDIDPEKSFEDISLPLKKIKKETRNRIDKEMISYVLEKTYWNRARAAKMLSVSYKMPYDKIDELDIRPNL